MSNDADSRPQDYVPPTIGNRKVPVRRANAAYRSREYLPEKEVVALMGRRRKLAGTVYEMLL